MYVRQHTVEAEYAAAEVMKEKSGGSREPTGFGGKATDHSVGRRSGISFVLARGGKRRLIGCSLPLREWFLSRRSSHRSFVFGLPSLPVRLSVCLSACLSVSFVFCLFWFGMILL